MSSIDQATQESILTTLTQFVAGVTGGRKLDDDALLATPSDKLYDAVLEDLQRSSLKDHMPLLNSKNQLRLACHVAADFVWSHPFEYQIIVAQLTIFFFHAEDILDQQPKVLRQLQRNVATGQPCGEPVLDWFARELSPRLWEYFDPLVANMIVISAYDFCNGIGVELLSKDARVHPQAPAFPDWLRFKTGLSPMYSLLALAKVTDMELPTGGLEKYVQAMPDVTTFTSIANDVISFYKELLAGEKGNYINMRAERDGVDLLSALETLSKEGIEVYQRVMSTLEDESDYQANFDAYAKGIVHFHTSCTRYRIAELLD